MTINLQRGLKFLVKFLRIFITILKANTPMRFFRGAQREEGSQHVRPMCRRTRVALLKHMEKGVTPNPNPNRSIYRIQMPPNKQMV